ncbi:hypothetical protein CSB20_11890 [bacterium DOLZORAL124_64_63]|nr:MAG: hypothetical protein CSB20_11890 [bacterium DOLZORAL124_64_63]
MNTGQWQRRGLMRLILGMFLIYMFFFWITNWGLWLTKMSFDPQVIAIYYLGDTASEFGLPPRPLGAMFEHSHQHLFAMGMLLLTLTHLVIFLPIPMRVKGPLVMGTFVAALLEQGADWIIRFGGAQFAWLKIAAFLALQIILLALIVALLVGIIRPMSSKRAGPGTPQAMVQGRQS